MEILKKTIPYADRSVILSHFFCCQCCFNNNNNIYIFFNVNHRKSTISLVTVLEIELSYIAHLFGKNLFIRDQIKYTNYSALPKAVKVNLRLQSALH